MSHFHIFLDFFFGRLFRTAFYVSPKIFEEKVFLRKMQMKKNLVIWASKSRILSTMVWQACKNSMQHVQINVSRKNFVLDEVCFPDVILQFEQKYFDITKKNHWGYQIVFNVTRMTLLVNFLCRTCWTI